MEVSLSTGELVLNAVNDFFVKNDGARAWAALAGITWAGVEYFRSEIWVLPCPWLGLGYSQAGSPVLQPDWQPSPARQPGIHVLQPARHPCAATCYSQPGSHVLQPPHGRSHVSGRLR